MKFIKTIEGTLVNLAKVEIIYFDKKTKTIELRNSDDWSDSLVGTITSLQFEALKNAAE